MPLVSIDQNSHSLWDALPKLEALSGRGFWVCHFVEDVDVAFTSLGSRPGGSLRLERERYYHSGGEDWGAAMFYSEFLGAMPVELPDWEPLTGMKTGVLAGKLGCRLEDLYDEFSPGDNWQLIGPSYVGDRDHHRVIGDLTVAETVPFLRQLLQIAKADVLERFPESGPQQRATEWFAGETALVEELIARHAAGKLVDLYRDWLRHYLGDAVRLDVTSSLFALDGGNERLRLLEIFLADYTQAAALYNQALADTGSHLHPLDTTKGELPFYAIYEHQGHLVRSGAFLQEGRLIIGGSKFELSCGTTCSQAVGGSDVAANTAATAPDHSGGNPARRDLPSRVLPVEQLKAAGIRCLAGKAALLVDQVRLGEAGRPLALPYRGSVYMPTAHRLAEVLKENGLLKMPIRPVLRVRFGLLEQMKSLGTLIRLPRHLAEAFGREQVTAGDLGRNHAALAKEAEERIGRFRDADGRRQWQRQALPEVAAELDRLDARRRELAKTAPKSEEIRGLWKVYKRLQTLMLRATLRQIARDWQVRDLDYYDSRGAILPWSIALGGEGFYRQVIAQAQVYEERG